MRAKQVSSRGGDLRVVDVCPIGCIREELEDGSDVYIGDIGFSRCTWPEVTDVEERERLIAENEEKKPGDPEIIWQIGGERVIFFFSSIGLAEEHVQTTWHQVIIAEG